MFWAFLGGAAKAVGDRRKLEMAEKIREEAERRREERMMAQTEREFQMKELASANEWGRRAAASKEEFEREAPIREADLRDKEEGRKIQRESLAMQARQLASQEKRATEELALKREMLGSPKPSDARAEEKMKQQELESYANDIGSYNDGSQEHKDALRVLRSALPYEEKMRILRELHTRVFGAK